MFYSMIVDLRANHFLLPTVASYNHLNIPYAYPPLSFYVAGLISLFGAPIYEILRWLPPFISTLSIAAFYWMASVMLSSRFKASLAAMVYALMPRLFSWYVMGGGLSRSFGLIFLILSCASAWILFTQRVPNYYMLWTALFGAGAILSHPETGIHAVAACILIWLFKGRTLQGFRDSLLVAVGVFLFTIPWWGTVLLQHGIAPFQSALNTGGHDVFFWVPWITFDFTEERFATIYIVLGLIGLAIQLIRKDWFLPILILLPFVVEPRSATAIAAIPLAILAGVGVSDLILPGLSFLDSAPLSRVYDWTKLISEKPIVKIVLAYIMLYGLIGAITYDFSLTNYIVTSNDRLAMDWIEKNTPVASRFVVLTGRTDPLADPVSEWFPTYSQRTSQTTPQGREWLLGRNFMPFLARLAQIQSCLNASPQCVEAWSVSNHLNYDYLYIEKSSKSVQVPESLLNSLRQNPEYAPVFENPGVVIFARK